MVRKTVIWLWGPSVDARLPPLLASLLDAGQPLATVPTANDVDLGNPMAAEQTLIVTAALDEDTLDQLHTDGIITPGDCHFVRCADFVRTASTTMSSVHGRQPQPFEKYAQARRYKTRLVVANEDLPELVANLLTAIGLDKRVGK